MKPAIINSLPKSGTNLLAKALFLLGYEQKFTLDASLVLRRSIRGKVNRLLTRSMSPGYIVGIDSPVEIAKNVVDRKLQGIARAEFISAHVGYTSDILNKSLQLGLSPLVVIRDPRSVLASFIPYVLKNTNHQANKFLVSLGDEDRYLSVLLGYSGNQCTIQSLQARCLALKLWVEHPETLVIRFEDIIGEKGGGSPDRQREMLLAICNHLQISNENINYVQEHLFGDQGGTFRTGKVDSWKDEIPMSIQEKLSETVGDVLHDWGYQ